MSQIISFKYEHIFDQRGNAGSIVDRSDNRYSIEVSNNACRLKLELGLIKLSEEANADQLLFWGKIVTTSSPYYIAMAIDFKGHYGFPHKKFYYRFVLNYVVKIIFSL